MVLAAKFLTSLVLFVALPLAIYCRMLYFAACHIFPSQRALFSDRVGYLPWLATCFGLIHALLFAMNFYLLSVMVCKNNSGEPHSAFYASVLAVALCMR